MLTRALGKLFPFVLVACVVLFVASWVGGLKGATGVAAPWEQQASRSSSFYPQVDESSTMECSDPAPARLPDLAEDPATNEQVDLGSHALTAHPEAAEIWQRIKAGQCEVYCFGEVAYILCPGMGEYVGFVPLQWHWSLNKWKANTAFVMDPDRARAYMQKEHGCTIDLGGIAWAGVFEEAIDD